MRKRSRITKHLPVIALVTMVSMGATATAFATDRNLLDDALDILNSAAPTATGDTPPA